MKILLTGATGFLGRHIVRKLTDEGIEIKSLVRKTSPISHLKQDNIKFFQGNLRNRESIRKAVKGVDGIIHAATSKGGPWPEFFADNVQGTEWLLEEAVKQKVKRFVFISSVAVYDHSQVKNGFIIKENHPKEKAPNHYSRSKIEAETLIEKYHKEQGLATTIIRPACIYGSGGFWYPSRLGFSAGKNYAVLGSGKSVVPLSHVNSVADLILLSLIRDEAAGKAYNVVEDEPVTRIEFLRLARENLYPGMKAIKFPYALARFFAWGLRTALKMAGMPPPTRLAPAALRLFAISVFYDNTRARQDLGWQPQQDVQQTIRDMLKWHQEQRKPVSSLQTPSWPVVIEGQRQLKTAVIGAGAFAKTHLDILKNIQQTQVVALCDPDLDRARALADQYGIQQTFKSMDDLFKSEKPAVVHIVSPAQTHAPLSVRAMQNGCHVLVEKPMAVNAKEAREMIEVSRRENVKLCVEHSNLYDGMMIQGRQWLNQRAVGKVIQVESWFGTGLNKMPMSPYVKYEGKDHWVYKLPGGVYQNFISHPLSCVLDVMGQIQNIQVKALYHKAIPYQDSDELRIQFDNGSAIGTLSLSMCTAPRSNFIRIYGEEGTIEIDFMSRVAFLNRDSGALPKVISRNLTARKKGKIYKKAGRNNLFNLITKKHGYFEGNEILIRLFYRSLIEGSPLPVTHENGLWSMEAMDAIWKQIDI
ncbi:NAD-dependent epimerase/dehydratase family protein [bacterium]|nr:NAD-dependent epimerase/dehydratase family protein [bacterium]